MSLSFILLKKIKSMTHLWIRSEQRDNEKRVGITPKGAALLIKNGFHITVEESNSRIIETKDYFDSGCVIAKEASWSNAPRDTIIFGLKELPNDSSALIHRHIMFGHAFKGQKSGLALLKRFKSGGGTLYDIEYLTEKRGKRVAAFGYWAGYAGAAVSLKVFLALKNNTVCSPLNYYRNKEVLVSELKDEFSRANFRIPDAIILGALGRVGRGASDFCHTLGLKTTKWDTEETKDRVFFKEILEYDVFLNCILANKDTPLFFSKEDIKHPRKLSVIGDIACDPDSDYNPIPVYNSPTSWYKPSLNICYEQPLSVMAIDNLPSLLPLESSIDFASQLLPYLEKMDNLNTGVWRRAEKIFRDNIIGA